MTPGNPQASIRSTHYGDTSSETVPLQGNDPIAVAYEHPDYRVQYRRTDLPMTVLPLNQQLTALTAETKGDGNLEFGGFVASVPTSLVADEPLVPSGTRLLHLAHDQIEPGSLSLVAVTLTANGEETRTLQEGRDFVLDWRSGVVTLARVIEPVDAELNPVTLRATYRLRDADDQRQLAFGVQATHTGTLEGSWGGEYQVGAGAASLDGQVTFGVRGRYENEVLRADSRVLVSGECWRLPKWLVSVQASAVTA
ncbi:hypothetical protein ACFP81_12350 [Deinococcus lacus]|uniref:Uncharacterized protein n=1 Tax=Deinococcus lacus TaxID=392561 RepID=A0ABW1YEH5_9DEIO